VSVDEFKLVVVGDAGWLWDPAAVLGALVSAGRRPRYTTCRRTTRVAPRCDLSAPACSAPQGACIGLQSTAAEDGDLPRCSDVSRDVRDETVLAGDPLDRVGRPHSGAHRLSEQA